MVWLVFELKVIVWLLLFLNEEKRGLLYFGFDLLNDVVLLIFFLIWFMDIWLSDRSMLVMSEFCVIWWVGSERLWELWGLGCFLE